jgi:phosphoribosyl-AMP cyclohydrolase
MDRFLAAKNANSAARSLYTHQDRASKTVSGSADITPDFSKGLIPTIVQDDATGEVLMLAFMNEEAFRKTLETGEAHYWSRSRNEIWHKGETSGHVQKIRALRIDCDSDALLLLVAQAGGAACHTGRRSCFYRELRDGEVRRCSPKIFDPKQIYRISS